MECITLVPRWEYRKAYDLSDAELNQMGKERWKLVTAFANPVSTINSSAWKVCYLFKQAVFDEVPQTEPKFKVGDAIEYVGPRKELAEDSHVIAEVRADDYVTKGGTLIPFKFQDDYRVVEPEQTEFEETVRYVLNGAGVFDKSDKGIHDLCKELLAIARKQLYGYDEAWADPYMKQLIGANIEYQMACNDAMAEEATQTAIEALKGLNLYELIHKQLEQEHQKELEAAYKNADEVQYNNGFRKGRTDALNELPTWKRLPLGDVSCLPNSHCISLVKTSETGGITTGVESIVKGNMYIPLYELDKLPKEE